MDGEFSWHTQEDTVKSLVLQFEDQIDVDKFEINQVPKDVVKHQL